jgi:ribA/ribD-fused uncharacterized protein
MRLFTAQYRYSGPYRLDITVKGNDPIGKFFAPTWDMVMEHKKTKNDQAYIDKYHALMLNSYANHRDIWDDVLSRETVVIVCFCNPNAFCHRHLLRHYLVKLGAQYMGEIKDLSKNPDDLKSCNKTINLFRNEYSWLSNFSPVEVTIEGITYKSVEHFFQARKFSPDHWERIAKCDKPKQEGKKADLPKNWDDIKVDVMRTGLMHKFSIPYYRDKLKNTGTALLTEGNWWHDNFWGNCSCTRCKDIEGANTLGKLLMDIRSKL